METTTLAETIVEQSSTTTVLQAAEFTAEQIQTIVGTMELLQGCLMVLIALLAIYILYLFINHFF